MAILGRDIICGDQIYATLVADRYMREISSEKLAEFINTKFENTTDEDVFPYNEELITDAYPVFVKFHELWCDVLAVANASVVLRFHPSKLPPTPATKEQPTECRPLHLPIRAPHPPPPLLVCKRSPAGARGVWP